MSFRIIARGATRNFKGQGVFRVFFVNKGKPCKFQFFFKKYIILGQRRSEAHVEPS